MFTFRGKIEIFAILLTLLVSSFGYYAFADTDNSKFVSVDVKYTTSTQASRVQIVIDDYLESHNSLHYDKDGYTGNIPVTNRNITTSTAPAPTSEPTIIINMTITYSGTVYKPIPSPTTPPPTTPPPTTPPPTTPPPTTTPPTTPPPTTLPPTTPPPTTTPPTTPLTTTPLTTLPTTQPTNNTPAQTMAPSVSLPAAQPSYIPVVTPEVSHIPATLKKDELISIYKSILDSNRGKIKELIHAGNKDWKLYSTTAPSIDLDNGEILLKAVFKYKNGWNSVRFNAHMYFDIVVSNDYSKFGIRFKKIDKINASNPSVNMPDQLNAFREKLQTSLKDSVFWYEDESLENYGLLNLDNIKK